MSPDVAIEVTHVRKDFVLPHARQSTLKGVFTNMLKKKDRSKDVQHALKDISFQVKKGEFFGIVGRNGSGKSTMLKMLAGIYQPTAGSVQTDGKIVALIELGVGFNPELTGRENVYLNGAIMGRSAKQINEDYERIVAFAGLQEFMDQKLKNYSSGMQVRLAFACATMADADILIVDEVLAVGDADFQKKCFKYFKEVKGSGKTVVLVTHDMSSVREYCDRAILIDDGLIEDEGDIESVTLSYQELFNPLSHSDAAVSRWGDGRAVISSVSVKHAKRTVAVHVKAKLNETLQEEDIVVAYAVKNEFGQKLFGNKSTSKKIHALPAGASYEFSFEFENILSDGRYFVDVSLFSVNKNEYLDCWVDCAEFQSMLGGVKGYSVIVKDSFDE